MAESASKVFEGVFAISKPPSLSSAQVIRDLQHAFTKSKTFAPLLESMRLAEDQKQNRPKRRRIDGNSAFKIGHGGTLDPMATGVLIIGIGRGTKSLQNFLDGTKSYETVVLFGKSTDTYDVAGKVVATADSKQITKEMVEQHLQAFRGTIKQVPPIYSAKKIDGMKAYDYARSGKELPRELAAKELNVSQCTLADWYTAGTHNFRWPAEEAPVEDRSVVQELIGKTESTNHLGDDVKIQSDMSETNAPAQVNKAQSPDQSNQIVNESRDQNTLSKQDKAKLHTHEITGLDEEPADAPAVRVKLTVSSGFYVRSFAHDLGIACGSYGTMATLARTRQAYFSISDPAPDQLVSAIDYADLAKGEEVWGPKITKVLDEWLNKNPVSDKPHYSSQRSSSYGQKRTFESRKRRNSSSPERD